MANRSRMGMVDNFLRGAGPVKPRSLAMMIMALGAFGFFVALLLFGENVLCLLGSTLVVFLGLGVILSARKYAPEQTETIVVEQPAARKVTIVRSKQSIRRRLAARGAVNQSPAPAGWSQTEEKKESDLAAPPPDEELHPSTVSEQTMHLVDHASEVFRQQGAEVIVKQVHGNRAVIRVETQDSRTFTVLVDEGPEEIQVRDLRSVQSMKGDQGTKEAVYISAMPFSEDAVAWAGSRLILLIPHDELESFTFPPIKRTD